MRVQNRGQMNIGGLTHPHYERMLREWFKWRITYEGGQRFIDFYLKQFSTREDVNDFLLRKQISYSPSFAKAAINEVKNSIFQRMVDITREGGSQTYQDSVAGRNGGVDLLGSSMNAFIGRKVLPELLTMAKIGIFVDMPDVTIPTLYAEQQAKTKPYLYYYPAEDIRSWIYDDSEDPNEFSSLLLRDYYFEYDPETKLPSTQKMRYRHLWKEDGVVWAKFYSENGEYIDKNGKPAEGPVRLNIPNIPFVILELSDSLLNDIANYQIALLNLESSDLLYALRSNFPIYTEQRDARINSPFLRNPTPDNGGVAADAQAAKPDEVKVGPGQGRAYPIGSERPGFIHPSSEPLKASMEKGRQMREDIRLLLNLAITNLQPRMASAMSKGFDERSLESGLSYIGLELENAEKKIAQYWDMYEKKKKVATVAYPEKYTLKSEEDRRRDAEQLTKIMFIVPSVTYQKEMAKTITDITVGTKVSSDVLKRIHDEIDNAEVMTSDPVAIASDVDHGLVSLDTASRARMYPPGEAEKAIQDHAARLARIAAVQGGTLDAPGARGADALSGNPKKDATDEKNDTTLKENLTPNKRGPAKPDNIPDGLESRADSSPDGTFKKSRITV